MKYKIIMLTAGSLKEGFPLDKAMFRYPSNETVPFKLGFAAIQGNGETILVDSGIPTDEEIACMGKEEVVGNRSFVEMLAEAGINPNEVKKVIQTHLHWDHAWNLDKLPNAQIYVQRAELAHAIAPYKHERGSFAYMEAKGFENPPFLKAANRMVALDGETEIQPGIRLIPTPGHTYGSQTVLVDTVEGTYALVGDFCNLEQAFEEVYMPGLSCSVKDWYEGYNRLKREKLAGIITFHDSKSYTRKVIG